MGNSGTDADHAVDETTIGAAVKRTNKDITLVEVGALGRSDDGVIDVILRVAPSDAKQVPTMQDWLSDDVVELQLAGNGEAGPVATVEGVFGVHENNSQHRDRKLYYVLVRRS